jgi:hypothetical protein
VAIVATIFGLLGRFVGKLLTAALGWASTLLFGRVPQDRQILLVLMTFGSVVWVVLLVGVVVPEVGTILLAFAPIPDFVDETWVRIGMLIGAILVPLGIGVAALLIQDANGRATGRAALATVLRGYPLAFVLAVVLVFLGVVAIVRKGRALLKRWKDAHVPVVVRPGGYDRTVDDLERALHEAGLDVRRGNAPAVLAMPPRLLATVAGSGVRSLVPDRLVQLTGDGLEVQLYPSDVALAGGEARVNRARAALASRLTAAPAFLTTSAEAQAIEERLETLANGRRYDTAVAHELRAIDDRLAHLELDYEEWEVLYRMRLQVERDLLTGRRPGAVPGEPARPVSAAPRASSGTPIEYATAAGLVALLVADIALALRDRVGR